MRKIPCLCPRTTVVQTKVNFWHAFHLRTITFPGNKNESDFIPVPSMFGGTKLVPKVASCSRSRSGRPSSFSNEQIDILENAFQRTQYPDSHLKRSLAHQIEQPVSRVQVRFFTIHRRKFVLAELVPKPTSQEDYAGQQACRNEPIKWSTSPKWGNGVHQPQNWRHFLFWWHALLRSAGNDQKLRLEWSWKMLKFVKKYL